MWLRVVTVGPLTMCRHHSDANCVIPSWPKVGTHVCELGQSWWGRTNDGALWPPALPSTAARTSSQVAFPIDFFEHNQQLSDVEFGGNDLLQVYNAQQIKHRLNSTGMYVANTKVRPGCTALGAVPGRQGSRAVWFEEHISCQGARLTVTNP